MPISNKQPYTFKMGSVKFYALFLKYEQVFEEEVIKAEVTRHTKDEVIAEVKRKYHAGELDPSEIETRERTYKGFHFFLFDQQGDVFMQLINTNTEALESIGNGIFLESPACEAETDQVYHNTLERDNWIDASPDVRFALETLRESIGLDLLAFKRSMDKATETDKETEI